MPKQDCEHIYDCGCGKVYCEECEKVLAGDKYPCECDNEECKHYYSYRNDNCDCRDLECPYCSEDTAEEEEEGMCGNCSIPLNHLRDGTTTEGHRCNNCYWEDNGEWKNMILPDYRRVRE